MGGDLFRDGAHAPRHRMNPSAGGVRRRAREPPSVGAGRTLSPMLPRTLVAIGLLLVLGVPLLLRPKGGTDGPTDALTLVVVTPHVEQITDEFAEAFDRWHRRVHGVPVKLDVRRPGGTSEIIRQLQAQFDGAVRNKDVRDAIRVEGTMPILPPGAIGYDIMFGGGTYDHGRLKVSGPTVAIRGGDLEVPMSVPAGFDQARLDTWFGENRIGAGPIYDPDQHWIGVAMSSFGIVYNRDVLRRLGLPEPSAFGDLTDSRLAGWVALADPRLSGSITTTFDSILNNEGWDEGWRILRGMCGNARYFTGSSTQPPIDVSAGEACAGLAIDFYGRAQAQSVTQPGERADESRVGYADPAGSVFIDPDPISILNGAPNPELARRFIVFALSDEGQALWQLRALERADGSPNPAASENPIGPGGVRLGPRKYELRRLPVRRAFYDQYLEYFVDHVQPYAIASNVESKGWRSSIGVMMGAFGIDTGEDCRQAWRALNSASAVRHITPARAEARERFYAFPTGTQVREHWRRLFPGAPVPEDACQDFTPETYGAVRNTWRDRAVLSRLEIVYAEVFRENYRRVVELIDSE